jgi:hypothetical protein
MTAAATPHTWSTKMHIDDALRLLQAMPKRSGLLRLPGVYRLYQGKSSMRYFSRGKSGDLEERLGRHRNNAVRYWGLARKSPPPLYVEFKSMPGANKKSLDVEEKKDPAGYGDTRELEIAQEAAEFLYELASELASTGGADPFSRSALR